MHFLVLKIISLSYEETKYSKWLFISFLLHLFKNYGKKPASLILEMPTQRTTNGTPVIATAAAPDKFGEVASLMKSVHSLLLGYTMLVYDLGLSTSDQVLVSFADARVVAFVLFPLFINFFFLDFSHLSCPYLFIFSLFHPPFSSITPSNSPSVSSFFVSFPTKLILRWFLFAPQSGSANELEATFEYHCVEIKIVLRLIFVVVVVVIVFFCNSHVFQKQFIFFLC